jgi:hypothetical protein
VDAYFERLDTIRKIERLQAGTERRIDALKCEPSAVKGSHLKSKVENSNDRMPQEMGPGADCVGFAVLKSGERSVGKDSIDKHRELLRVRFA